MYKSLSLLLSLCIVVVLSACSSNKAVSLELPSEIPDFVQQTDFENVDWEKKAEEFGDWGVVGNDNMSGVIGADVSGLGPHKWMWHLWGIENTELTIVGHHRESQLVEKILTDGWTVHAQGENNGADAHAPSNVEFSKPGEWAILLYTDGKLFDTLVFDLKE
ncbi:hypothetical protein SPD48_08205 [Pseudogracilibacillus sp. SE30717A]|uniref:hypothetical protein n=1 Tax=Pseudogracilibacillus sp. SE30717A TaxID=3098293 RepID=UPI00300E2E86